MSLERVWSLLLDADRERVQQGLELLAALSPQDRAPLFEGLFGGAAAPWVGSTLAPRCQDWLGRRPLPSGLSVPEPEAVVGLWHAAEPAAAAAAVHWMRLMADGLLASAQVISSATTAQVAGWLPAVPSAPTTRVGLWRVAGGLQGVEVLGGSGGLVLSVGGLHPEGHLRLHALFLRQNVEVAAAYQRA